MGIKDHVENFLLGKVVVIVNLLATVPMQFSPSDDGGGERATILLERWSIIALTGKCRYKYKHRIPSSEHDIIAGEKVARPRRVSMILPRIVFATTKIMCLFVVFANEILRVLLQNVKQQVQQHNRIQ